MYIPPGCLQVSSGEWFSVCRCRLPGTYFGIERAANAAACHPLRGTLHRLFTGHARMYHRLYMWRENWNTHTQHLRTTEQKQQSPKAQVRCCYRGPVGLLRRILWKASRSSSPHLQCYERACCCKSVQVCVGSAGQPRMVSCD